MANRADVATGRPALERSMGLATPRRARQAIPSLVGGAPRLALWTPWFIVGAALFVVTMVGFEHHKGRENTNADDLEADRAYARRYAI